MLPAWVLPLPELLDFPSTSLLKGCFELRPVSFSLQASSIPPRSDPPGLPSFLRICPQGRRALCDLWAAAAGPRTHSSFWPVFFLLESHPQPHFSTKEGMSVPPCLNHSFHLHYCTHRSWQYPTGIKSSGVCWAPAFLIQQQVKGGARRSAFLTSSQMMLLLLVQLRSVLR